MIDGDVKDVISGDVCGAAGVRLFGAGIVPRRQLNIDLLNPRIDHTHHPGAILNKDVLLVTMY